MNKLKRFKLNYSPHIMLALCALGTVVLNVPVLFIFKYAEKLGWLWLFVLFGYFGLLITLYALILRPRQYAYLRYTLGDELFFELYPREKEKELRRNEKARAARRKKLERQRERELRKKGL